MHFFAQSYYSRHNNYIFPFKTKSVDIEKTYLGLLIHNINNNNNNDNYNVDMKEIKHVYSIKVVVWLKYRFRDMHIPFYVSDRFCRILKEYKNDLNLLILNEYVQSTPPVLYVVLTSHTYSIPYIFNYRLCHIIQCQ